MIKPADQKAEAVLSHIKTQQRSNNQTKPTPNKNMQHNLRRTVETSLKQKIKLKLSSRVIGPSLAEDNVAVYQR